ncbi:hypothetical protein, partial [Methylobacterium sp. A54F]
DGSFRLIGRRFDDGKLRVIDAASRAADHIDRAEVEKHWDGTIILVARRLSVEKLIADFGLTWFVLSILPYQ